jgi:hypothetical protein
MNKADIDTRLEEIDQAIAELNLSRITWLVRQIENRDKIIDDNNHDIKCLTETCERLRREIDDDMGIVR